MIIGLKENVDSHWWGERIVLLTDLNEYYMLSEEETFLIEYFDGCAHYEDIIEKIAIDTGLENGEIESILKIFMENFKEYLEEKNKEEKNQITGKKGWYYPIELHISLTNACKQKCLHCYKCAEDSGEYINYNDLIKFLNRMQGYVPYLTLSGGEPTMHSHFKDVLERYSDKYSISILSSGVKIPEKIIKECMKAERGMTVSLYGDCAITHDKFAQRSGSFEAIMDTIKKVKAMGGRIGVSIVATSENRNQIENLIKTLNEMKVDSITVGQLMNTGRARENDLYFAQKADSDWIEKLEEMCEQYKNVLVLEQNYIYKEGNASNIISRIFKCLAGSLIWAVYETGEIHPCAVCTRSEFLIGHIGKFESTMLKNREEYEARLENHPLIEEMNRMGRYCPYGEE